MTQVVLREATTRDAAALADLTGHLGYPTSGREMARRLEPILRDQDRVTLVAEVEGEVVAYGGAWIGRGYEADAPHSRVTALVVHPDHRRRGLGAQLLLALERWSRDRGASVIVLTSGDWRTGAHQFYEQLGYAATGRRYRKELPADPD